ncbi:MAG: hypothetical protein KIT09_06725 [Bryobacteraceae bacterium]|nr:hypothetical protein [Bryobacteraceae bacterium]
MSMEAIPDKALRRFEKVEGIPLPVIAELFSRMQLAGDLQQAFWQQVAAKPWEQTTGSVRAVTTMGDGVTLVEVIDRDGSTTIFYHPRDMSDQQLDESKRAQSHGLSVRVMYQDEAEKRPVKGLEVFSSA